MKRLSPYLKMRVLGAIEFALGNSIIARIHHVSAQTFNDEEGVPLKWRLGKCARAWDVCCATLR